MELFDLRTLSQRFNLPVARLRYVLNQELLPEQSWFLAEAVVGQPRHFGFDTAILIGCAAFMLEGGIKRDAIRALLQAISRIQPDGRNPLKLPAMAHVLMSNHSASVQAGDAVRVRCMVGRHITDWIDPSPPIATDQDFEPRIIVAMDIGGRVSWRKMRERKRICLPSPLSLKVSILPGFRR